MATLQQLEAKVAELQSSVDAEQQQIADLLQEKETFIAEKEATIQSLNEQVAILQGLVDAAPTPEQLQAVVSNLEAIKADLESTVGDGPVEEDPIEEDPTEEV